MRLLRARAVSSGEHDTRVATAVSGHLSRAERLSHFLDESTIAVAKARPDMPRRQSGFL